MNNELSIEYIVNQLSKEAKVISAKDARANVPSESGIYSIFIDNPRNLPDPFDKYLIQKNTLLIYIGKTIDSLMSRLVEEDLRHKRPSTFFRGLGSVLGYSPPAGSLIGKKNQNNYRFNQKDTKLIIDWINTHLSIRWVETSSIEVDYYEPQVIKILKPLLNTTHNPDAIPELARIREECRRIARS